MNNILKKLKKVRVINNS